MTLSISTFQALQKLDTNRNGLSLDELRKVDKDGNGSLSAEEAKSAGFAEADRALLNRRMTGKTPASAFVFTSQEMNALKVLAPLHSNFASLDTDGNQLISSAELGKALGNPRFKGEEAAAITAAYKHLADFKSLSDDTGWLPKLPANQWLDKIPLHTYDERGISRQDMEAFLDAAKNNNSAISEAMGRFSMSIYAPAAVNPEIFPKGLESIRPNNITQGEIGDCYFLAAVASLANTSAGKKQIQNMIKDLGNGQVQVTFPGKQPVKIYKPTDSELSLYSNAGSDGMWLSILEKAYAHTRNEQGWTSWIYQNANPYDKIGSGGQLATGIGGVTGKWADTDILLLTSLSSLRLKLQQAVVKKQVITAGTSPQLPWTGETTKNGLPLSHAYSVLDFDPKTDMVTVRNPWGQTEVSDGHGPRDGVNDGTFKMPLAEFKSSFNMICYEG